VPDDTLLVTGEVSPRADTAHVSSAVIDPPRTDASEETRPSSWRNLAWSRAGAIAVVLAAAPSTRSVRFSVRVALLVAGSFTIAVAVALTLWNGLGPGPLDVFIGAVRVRTGLPIGPTVWLVVGTMIVISWLLGRRPGPGTIISPLIIGSVMQVAATTLEPFGAPDTLAVRIGIHLLAVGAIGLGAGALIVSRLGAGSGELLAAAASDRSGRPEPRARMAIELSLLAAGVALGGPVGLGTILLALTIGPAVAVGHRIVYGAVAQTSERSREITLRSRRFSIPGDPRSSGAR
jgi:uncharacterized membrane protein YczE